MTFKDSKSNLLMMIKDVGGKAITPLYTNFLINEGQKLLCRVAPLLLDKSIENILTVEAPDFAPPGVMVNRVYFDGKRLTPKTVTELDKEDEDWRTEEGTPVKYTIDTGKIKVYPWKAGTLKVDYNPYPITLTTDTQIPDYNEDIHNLIVLGAYYYWLIIHGKRTDAQGIYMIVQIEAKEAERKHLRQQRDYKLIQKPDHFNIR